ncbi:potassium channel subfamily K member 17-like [Petaurus breviceps papuanus]|uniref:potassium channel subfamily K member 17-like n=1 Tax=Petaurus breviceps papuanus TaxID=3040969 RepID=UPI0036DDB504
MLGQRDEAVPEAKKKAGKAAQKPTVRERAPDLRRRCAVPGTPLLLGCYLAYLALGTSVFQALESSAKSDSEEGFRRENWALLRNYTCLDSPALEALIWVRPGYLSGLLGRWVGMEEGLGAGD